MTKTRTLAIPLSLAVAAAVVMTACGADGGDPGDEVTLTVFAAASLTDTFTEIGERFEEDHPGVVVEFSFAGSSDLVAQLRQGAPADVFASADEPNMAKATDDDLVDGDPVLFATNVPQIATPPDNPAGVETLQDLARDGLAVVVCAPEVPCGAASQRVEQAAGIVFAPVSEERSVTDVLGKIVAGEADAGMVYVTDVAGAGDSVQGIDFPESAEAVNSYPIAALAGSEHSDHAHAFVEFVTGERARVVLDDAGFGAP